MYQLANGIYLAKLQSNVQSIQLLTLSVNIRTKFGSSEKILLYR